MKNSTRVFLCRTGIILFCLLPTATVGGWIVQRASGRYAIAQKAEWERELTGRLGLVVRIDAVSYPGPLLARLDNVRLLDPESGSQLAQAAVVDVISEDDCWRVEVWQPQIAADRLGEFVRTLDQRLLRGPAGGGLPCVLAARELTIVGAQSGQTLMDVSCRIEPAAALPQAKLAFRWPESAASGESFVHLDVVRNRQQSPPATEWRLDTAGESLPLSVLATCFPSVTRLGADCRFDGKLVLIESAEGRSGECSGTLENVDFDSLVTEHFPHQLSGVGIVKVERAAFDRGKLVELRGTLQAHDGVVSHSLLAAAQEHLRLVLAADNPTIRTDRLIPYRRLSLGFHLDGRAVSLTGSADATQEGVLLANASGPILQAPAQHAAPTVALLRTLLPENQYQVPATRQTDALVSVLPVPDLAPARTATRAAAHVPTRLVPAAERSTAPAIRQPALR